MSERRFIVFVRNVYFSRWYSGECACVVSALQPVQGMSDIFERVRVCVCACVLGQELSMMVVV